MPVRDWIVARKPQLPVQKTFDRQEIGDKKGFLVFSGREDKSLLEKFRPRRKRARSEGLRCPPSSPGGSSPWRTSERRKRASDFRAVLLHFLSPHFTDSFFFFFSRIRVRLPVAQRSETELDQQSFLPFGSKSDWVKSEKENKTWLKCQLESKSAAQFQRSFYEWQTNGLSSNLGQTLIEWGRLAAATTKLGKVFCCVAAQLQRIPISYETSAAWWR